MASLYTPEPQRQGLDWLAGMTRDAQSLWQNQQQIDQAKQRLALASQQQQMQEQHFWEEQKRLKGQEDFQNRKFLYEIGKDKRDETRQGVLDTWFHENQIRDDNRQNANDIWSRSPQNPVNRWHVAQAGAAESKAAGENAAQQRLYGTQDPRLTTYGQWEPGYNSSRLNALGKSVNDGMLTDRSVGLSPDIEEHLRKNGVQMGDNVDIMLNDGSIIKNRQLDDRTDGSLTGRVDLFSKDKPDPRSGAGVTGFRKVGTDNFVELPRGRAPKDTTNTPEVKEIGGQKFAHFLRPPEKGGDYWQAVHTPDQKREITPEIVAAAEKQGLEISRLTSDGKAVFTRINPAKGTKGGSVQLHDVKGVDEKGNEKITTYERDPKTGEWAPIKIKDSSMSEPSGAAPGGIKDVLREALSK